MLFEQILTVVMVVLSVLYLSWFVLCAIPKRGFGRRITPSISIVVPAYNEAANIERTIGSITSATYPGKKEIIIIDDGSTDGTGDIVKRMAKSVKNLRLIKTNHVGKAMAVNAAIRHSKNEVLVILDADTEVNDDAFFQVVQPFSDGKVAAVASTLRVKVTWNPLTWFQEFEYGIATGWRYAVDNINGSCIVPGFCAFRKSMIVDVGGMKGDTAVEDYDICMYLKKAGYKIRMAEKAVAYTVVPQTLAGLIRQRIRWNRGTLQTMRKHNDVILNKKHGAVGLYSVPIQSYWFVHAMIYIPLVLYQIVSGYVQWFASKGDCCSADAVMYFIRWFTTYGTFDYIYNFATAAYPATLLNSLVALVIFLSFSFGVWSLLKFSGRTPSSLVGLVFFFPYTMVMLSMYIVATLLQIFERDRGEKWEKVS